MRRFAGETADQMYEEAVPPVTPDSTVDPACRGLNHLRAKIGLSLIDRSHGHYIVEDMQEPEASIRILQHPFGYWGHNMRRHAYALSSFAPLLWLHSHMCTYHARIHTRI